MRARSQQELQWRRDKVRELSTKGWTQRQIADKIQLDVAIINRDLKYLRYESAKNIQHYITERLPAEYENAINTLAMISKEMWELQPKDNRELIQSRMLIKECTAMKVELIASGTVVDRAMKFVQRKKAIILPQSSITQNTEVLKDGSVR